MAFDPSKTAVLTLDIQHGILAMVPGAAAVLEPAAAAVSHARAHSCHLIHVGLGFEPGYPEISPRHPRFSQLKERGAFLKGSESAAFPDAIYLPGDLVIYKHRVSAFAGNALAMTLAARSIDTLVLFGVATSGIVLSTLRAASDMDFTCVVLSDACLDRDPEVHRVLTEKVFPAQAAVMTVDEWKSRVP